MKHATMILTAALAVLVAGTALHAQQNSESVPRWTAAVNTNAVAVSTNAPYSDEEVYAWADTFILELSGMTAPTCTVKLVTMAGSDTGKARTLLTLSNTTGGVFPFRDLVTGVTGTDIANTPARSPLFSRLRLLAYAANKTNITAKAWLVTTDTP